MKNYFVLASLLLANCAMPSSDRNTKWIFDIPQGDIEFIFLPSNLNAVTSGVPSTATEIEATYNVSAEAGNEVAYLDPNLKYSAVSGFKGSEGTSIKVKTQIPSFRSISEVSIDVSEEVPTDYVFKSTGKVDRNSFSSFMSGAVSKKYYELNKLAKEKGGNAVVVVHQSTYLYEASYQPKYGIFIKAYIVKKAELSVQAKPE